MVSSREVGSVAAAAQVSGVRAATEPPSTAARPAEQGATGDPVAVSGGSQAVARWLDAIHRMPAVRADRVAQVRARAAAGQQPTPGEVAGQILRRAWTDRKAGRL